MSFPQVQDADTTSKQFSVNTTPWDFTYCGNIENGNLLLVLIAIDSATATSGWPAGWVQIGTQADPAVDAGMEIWAKIADGTETGVFNITTGGERGCWRMYRITGWKNSGVLTDDIKFASSSSSADGTPDPPNLTPGWGAEDTLWFAVMCSADDHIVSAYPTNYTNTTDDNSGPLNAAELAQGRRELNAASENPGTFTVGSPPANWSAATIAIRTATVSITLTEADNSPIGVIGRGRGW